MFNMTIKACYCASPFIGRWLSFIKSAAAETRKQACNKQIAVRLETIKINLDWNWSRRVKGAVVVPFFLCK